ncbi:MAG: hypothetical protein P8J27_11780 [Mariniblastus sp.]|nr:hypothetical protein [Mariniblastus sp.]
MIAITAVATIAVVDFLGVVVYSAIESADAHFSVVVAVATTTRAMTLASSGGFVTRCDLVQLHLNADAATHSSAGRLDLSMGTLECKAAFPAVQPTPATDGTHQAIVEPARSTGLAEV